MHTLSEEQFNEHGWPFFKSYIERSHEDLALSYMDFAGNESRGTQKIHGFDLRQSIFWCIYLGEFNSIELESTYRYLQALSAQGKSFTRVYLFASQHKTSETECMKLSGMISQLKPSEFKTHLVGYRFCGSEDKPQMIAMQEFITMQPSLKSASNYAKIAPRQTHEKQVKDYNYLEQARLDREELRLFIDLELDFKMLNS
jgi:hypothetical protein